MMVGNGIDRVYENRRKSRGFCIESPPIPNGATLMSCTDWDWAMICTLRHERLKGPNRLLSSISEVSGRLIYDGKGYRIAQAMRVKKSGEASPISSIAHERVTASKEKRVFGFL